MKEGKVCYYELLREEEKFCREEQNAVLSELLSTNRTSLSLLRRAGLALTGLEVSGKRTGRGGRIVIEFSIDRGVGKNNTSNTSNSNSNSNTNNCCFKAGEPVKLVVNGQLLQSTIGTVERPVTEEKICVSLRSEGEDFDILLSSSRVSLVKVMDNSGNFEKMRRNLDELSKGTRDLLKELRGFVFEGESDVYASGDNTTVVDSETKETNHTIVSSDTKYTAVSLNEEQMEAVERSFSMFSSMRENMFLLHGPPGTGKTSTVVAIIQRLLSQTDKKILVCGPSNLSVDNITEKLIEGCGSKTGKIVRLGHPSRVLESCQEVTLDHLQETSDMGQLLKDVQGEIDELVRVALPRCRSREERRVIYAELKELRSERKKREFLLSGQVLKAARVVLCTLSTASGGKLKDFLFDVSIVDEAGQALLPEVLIAPLRAKKLLLAGDHFQLPATVQNCAVKGKLEVSLFERLLSGKGNSLMLKQQYRMNSQIMAWSNQKFYSNQLRAHPSVANRKLEFSSSDGLSDSLIFYDTCGFDLWETNEGESSLKSSKNTILLSIY